MPAARKYLFRTPVLVALLAAPHSAVAQTQQEQRWCEGEDNPTHSQRIEACSAVIRAARDQGFRKAAKAFAIFPGSGGVKRQIEKPDPRLDGESIADVFRSVGGHTDQ